MRIFTAHEYMQGHIPRREDFPAALSTFEAACILPHIPEKVVGAFTYGSMWRGDFTIASDIDYFAVVRDDAHLAAIGQAAQQALDQRHVSIQTRVISIDVAVAGMHGIDPAFREHLARAVSQNGCHGGNPLLHVAEVSTAWEDACRSTLASYVKKFANAKTNAQDGTAHTEFLKLIAEKPNHVMRVMLQFFRGPFSSDLLGDFPDTHQEIFAAYRKLGWTDLVALLDPLHKARTAYVGLLEQRHSGPPDVPRYQAALRRFEDCFPNVYRFTKENALRMMD